MQSSKILSRDNKSHQTKQTKEKYDRDQGQIMPSEQEKQV